MSDPKRNPSIHQDEATDMITRIKAIVAERLPGIVATTVTNRRRLNSAASLPDDFLVQIIVAIENKPEAGVMNNITTAELRDVIAFSSEYLKFAGELEMIVRSVRAIVAETRYDVCQRALGVYGVVKGIERPNRKPAQSNAKALRLALGRGRRRKTAEPPPTETQPRS
jgi:hypothetical protein